MSLITRSYSAAFLLGDLVVWWRKPITILIQSRKSRSHFHGVDQSSSMTHVVWDSNDGVKVSCNRGVNDAEGVGNNDIVNRASMSEIRNRTTMVEC